MSHWTTIKTQVRDIAALKLAVEELRLKLLCSNGVPATARGWNGNEKQCDYAIQLPGKYDIAVTKQADNSYALDADFYDGSVVKVTGKNFGKLIQLYGVHKATLAARRNGLQVNRQALANGSVKLVLTGAKL